MAHVHAPASGPDGVRRALRWALALNAGFLLVEAVVGFWSGSLALLSDAAHMVSDVVALAIALTATVLARRPVARDRTYGFARAEALGAFANALLLAGACALIVRSAVIRLYTGETHFEAEPVLIVGAIGLAINLGSALMLARTDRTNLNVRGAMIHMLADALGSVAAIAAAALSWGWGLHAADPALSLFTAALILWSAWGVLRDSTFALLDFAPAHLPQERVEAELRGLDGVQEIHELHLWSIGDAAVLTAHLVPRPGVAPADLLARAEHVLREHLGISHTTIQIDGPGPGPCTQQRCPLFDPEQLRPREGHHHHHHGHGHGHGHGHAH